MEMSESAQVAAPNTVLKFVKSNIRDYALLLSLLAVWSAAKALLATVPKEEAPGFVSAVRKAVSAAFDVQRRKPSHEAHPGPVEVPALCLPKGLEPLLEIYLQGLLQVRPRGVLAPYDTHRRALQKSSNKAGLLKREPLPGAV